MASCVTAEPSDFAVLTTDWLKQMLDDQPRMGHKFLLMLRGLTTLRLRIATILTQPRPLDETDRAAGATTSALP